MSSEIFLDKADPYPGYRRMRASGSAHEVLLASGSRAWVVVRHPDIRELLADPRLCKDRTGVSRGPTRVEELVPPGLRTVLFRNMLGVDPPEHTRLRGLVAQDFTSRRIRDLGPSIRRTSTGLLHRLGRREPFDLIADFAYPLLLSVISDLVGVPSKDRAQFSAWSHTMVAGFAARSVYRRHALELVGYLRRLIARRRAAPQADLVSALTVGQDRHERLTEDELVGLVFLLITAGHETSVNLIGNGVLAMLTYPDQRAYLRRHPAAIPNAVEEFLRFDPPLEMAPWRYATTDIDIDDQTIPTGAGVLLSLASANRDEQVFEHPDVLDVTRSATHHVAFGHGIHHCLGAPLARLEATIAIETMLASRPDLRLLCSPSDVQRRDGMLLRGPLALPVQ